MKRAVILLHGRDATAQDILGLRGEFDLPGVAWFAPQADGRTWYPYSFLAPIEHNEPWLSRSLAQVAHAVDDAIRQGFARENIAIAGFSQGACLATEFVARNPARYGGLIAFTGGLIGPPGIPFQYSGDLAGTPAFLGSGDPDPHVPWERVEKSAAVLTGMGAEVTLRRYPGLPHTISKEEIAEARSLLSTTLQYSE
ncbi:MAG TPA: dienelactone hydrolase family protein [Bryobacteraceae bacterium]|jgi:predicted esterase|nr:dienelactone hydrolase family protein [Bryobacteraceae bacterium]